MPEFEVTIDTNVFVHLFNIKNNNEDAHIDKLLSSLVDRRATLCVDDKGRMKGEYVTHVVPLIKKASDETLKVYWLRYLMEYNEWHSIPVDFGDQLMVSIRRVLVIAERSDHVFVYVAIGSNTVLVSNNAIHITHYRNELRKCAKKCGSKVSDFLSSRQAVAAL
ncbi:MAG: hypothetical protein WA738_21750 [Candidatus Angelobacter sp.]